MYAGCTRKLHDLIVETLRNVESLTEARYTWSFGANFGGAVECIRFIMCLDNNLSYNLDNFFINASRSFAFFSTQTLEEMYYLHVV